MMQCPERPLVRDQPGWSIPEERQTCRGKFPVEPAFRFLERAGFSTVRSVSPSKGETGAKSQPIPKGRCDQVQLPSTVPCLRDKIVQEAIRMALEPIFEVEFHDRSYGFRPNRSTHHAIAGVNN